MPGCCRVSDWLLTFRLWKIVPWGKFTLRLKKKKQPNKTNINTQPQYAGSLSVPPSGLFWWTIVDYALRVQILSVAFKIWILYCRSNWENMREIQIEACLTHESCNILQKIVNPVGRWMWLSINLLLSRLHACKQLATAQSITVGLRSPAPAHILCLHVIILILVCYEYSKINYFAASYLDGPGLLMQ